MVAWWLIPWGVGYETERFTVQCPADALPSNNPGQVVHTHLLACVGASV